MSGRHRPSGLFRSRAVRTPIVVISALALIGAGALILRAVSADADGCSSTGLRLTVVADPAIAPAISQIGALWTATRPAVGGDCIQVAVIAKPSHALAAQLGIWAGGFVDVAGQPVPTPVEADLPAVWIPDSSYWLGRVQEVDREMFDIDAESVASSPIVLAVPESVVRANSAQLSGTIDAVRLGKLALAPKGAVLKLGLVEPRRDTAGMVGAMALSEAVMASEGDLPKLVQVYRALGTRADDVDGLWKAIGQQAANAATVSEQALLTYNANNGSAPMTALPLTGVAALDFPYAMRARQARPITEAAAAFRAVLTGGQHRLIFAEHRLRGPDGRAAPGFPAGHGITTAAVQVLPLTDLGAVSNVLTTWVAARTPSRIVAMVDTTSSMGLPLNGGPKTRMQVMREAAVTGLGLFTPESLVGLWAFAGPGHRNLVPLEVLGGPGSAQRVKLTTAVSQAAPGPVDVCPLYRSIVAGYKELLTGYRPELSNTLVVFTDGPDSTDTDLRQILRDLEILADVTRPVRVILLGIGPDIDKVELDKIAATTGGKAFQVNSPEQMQTIFLQALLT